MNLRNILKIYNLERQLTSDDVALLNTLRGMNEGERELLVESLGPQGKGAKKAGKKSSASNSSSSKKSSRAQSLAGAIQKTPKAKVDDDSSSSNDQCTYELSYGPCLGLADDNIHHLTNHPNYHEFVEGKSHALAAGGE